MSPYPVRVLLYRLIDYAGLFPPAELSMKTTVRNFASYHNGRQSFALARLVVPAERLLEFEAVAEEFLSEEIHPGDAWRVAALCGNDLESELLQVEAFAQRQAGRIRIDSLEVRAGQEDDLALLDRVRRAGRHVFVEIPLGEGLGARLDGLQRLGLNAKIRTGGLTPEAIPEAAALLEFLQACRGRNVAFKATAGLHHPVRGWHFLTANPDGPRGRTHGFLNLVLGAAFLTQGLPEEELLEILEESSSAAFECDESGFRWHGRRLETATLAHVRSSFAMSFGSCSFVEPMDDLVAMGLL